MCIDFYIRRILRRIVSIISNRSPSLIHRSKNLENTKPDLFGKLTNREMEILYWLAEGLRNQQIADRLNITIQTVKFHTGNIYPKLGINCRSEAIAWVWRTREPH